MAQIRVGSHRDNTPSRAPYFTSSSLFLSTRGLQEKHTSTTRRKRAVEIQTGGGVTDSLTFMSFVSWSAGQHTRYATLKDTRRVNVDFERKTPAKE